MANQSSSEKQGAARWAKCPSCDEWVHVSEGMLAMPTIELYCPSCEHRFAADDAAERI